MRHVPAALLLCLAGPAAAEDYVLFHSPSGNIHCMILTGEAPEVRCDILELAAPIPDPPSDCELDWGHAFGIGPADKKGYRICAGDTVADPAGLVLDYGDKIELSGFRCQSEETGMTCTNEAGHGFALSRRQQKLF